MKKLSPIKASRFMLPHHLGFLPYYTKKYIAAREPRFDPHLHVPYRLMDQGTIAKGNCPGRPNRAGRN